jgi:hypothetical protein
MTRRRIASIAAAAAMALTGTLTGCGSERPSPSAADQVPRLAAVLHKVDAALASHRFTAARQYLRSLKSEVLTARESGDLREADATRVLDAISRLTASLPAATPTTSSTPRPESSSTTPSARPTRSRSPRPTQQASSTPTPTPTPSVTSGASATPTSSPDTSTPGPTREASPSSSPTATP